MTTLMSATLVNRALDSVTIPDVGLTLRATWNDPTDLLSRRDCDIVVSLTDRHTRTPVNQSTNHNGHWADIVQVSDRYWVSRHIDRVVEGVEYIVFATFDDAYSHYVQVVRGQQDATAGEAWTVCDVPDVLAGEDLALAVRAGYSYEDAERQYADDRPGALRAWAALAGLLI